MKTSMRTSIKAMLITSIVSFATLSYAMAEEPDDMPYHNGMMQGGPGYGMMGQGYGPGPGGYGPGYHMGPGYGMGYGMMGQGYGRPGPGGYGPGYHMGPGYGMGYGMMGPGYGMHGYGPSYGMGYGMHPGFGMGPGYGMMGPGYGMMGPRYGMMGPRYGMGINLSKEQNKQIEQIQNEQFKKQRSIMRDMWQEQKKLGDIMTSDKQDPKAIENAYGRISELQKKAFKQSLDMQKQMDGVLTDEQKKQIRNGYPRPMMNY